MARELLLLRHGKSDWDNDLPDFERPLKDRGKRGAQRIGVWLWQQDLRPDRIVSSPAERAITTAHKCCKSMDRDVSAIIEEPGIYAAALDGLLSILAALPANDDRVMLVGHNPGFEELLAYLAGSGVTRGKDGKLLPTATLARLAMPPDWRDLQPGTGRLLDLVRPRDLPGGFPYPAPHGKERRKRPAYYYTQSAVIPYRLTDSGELQILVIGSSKKNHWVVPKGIKEPELSPQASAAREAEEEAGIHGDVEDTVLGQYTVDKWGASCQVTVYPMRVHTVLEEQHWEENHRERRWLQARQAAALLRQPELGAMVLSLAQRLAG